MYAVSGKKYFTVSSSAFSFSAESVDTSGTRLDRNISANKIIPILSNIEDINLSKVKQKLNTNLPYQIIKVVYPPDTPAPARIVKIVIIKPSNNNNTLKSIIRNKSTF